jgi:hypothetical protein
MRGMVGKFGHRGGLLPAVLALFLLFKLLIPSGYMIAPDHEGRPGLALCAAPAAAAAEAAQHGDHDGNSADPAPSGPSETPCAYAALAAPPLPPEPPVLWPRTPPAAVPPVLPSGVELPLLAPASPPPPARGPPIPV